MVRGTGMENNEGKGKKLTKKPSTTKKSSWGINVWCGLIIVIIVFVSLFVYISAFSPQKFQSSLNSQLSSHQELKTLLMILFVVASGIWWLLTKIWPFVACGILIGWVLWLIKDAVRSGVGEALERYSDDLKDKLAEVLQDYFVHEKLSKTIQAAVSDSIDNLDDKLDEISNKLGDNNIKTNLDKINANLEDIKSNIENRENEY